MRISRSMSIRLVAMICSACFLWGAWLLVEARMAPKTTPADPGRAATRGEVKLPRAVVDHAEHHFGFLDPSEACEHIFIIRNEGQADLELSRGPTSCQCTMSELPHRSIPPGGAAEVRVASKIAQKEGYFSHTATIGTNDPDKESIMLSIDGTIRTYLGANPSKIILSDSRADSARAAETVLYSQVWPTFEIQKLTTSDERIQCRVEPAEASLLGTLHARSGYRLHVTVPPDLPTGWFREQVRVLAAPAGSAREARAFDLVVAGNVLPSVSLTGRKLDGKGILRLGVAPYGEGIKTRLTLKVRDEHRNLVVREIETQPEFLRVSVHPYQPGKKALGLYRIEVEIPPGAPSGDFMGARRGHIRIDTDHPERPVLEMDVLFAITKS